MNKLHKSLLYNKYITQLLLSNVNKKILYLILASIVLSWSALEAQINNSYILEEKDGSAFTLSSKGKSAPLCVASNDFAGVHKILKFFQKDIEAVTGTKPEIWVDKFLRVKDRLWASKGRAGLGEHTPLPRLPE